MVCDSCKKNNASFHYTKIINGKVEELHLCEHCAMENQELDLDKQFSITKLFTSLIDSFQEPKEKNTDNIVCLKCGLTYSNFKTTGKFGCSNCYEAFKDKLDPLIKGIHGNNEHKGKIPKRSNERIFLRREEESLKEDLEDAVKKEEFERAAFLRDEIKKIKMKLESFEE